MDPRPIASDAPTPAAPTPDSLVAEQPAAPRADTDQERASDLSSATDQPPREDADRVVDEADQESFPASDAPASWAG